jgi:hypothetical protein
MINILIGVCIGFTIAALASPFILLAFLEPLL